MNTKQVTSSVNKSTWGQRALKMTGLIVGLYILVFLVLPFFALRYVEHWYAEQGEHRSLLIKGWTLSPLTGEVQLRDVTARYPKGQHTAEVGAEFVGIDVDLSALFSKTIHVQSIGINGLIFRGSQTQEGLSIAGVDIASSTNTPDPQEPNSTSTGILPNGWVLQIDDISLTDNLVRWEQSGLSVAVRLSKFSTGLFNSSTESNTPVSLDVTLESLRIDNESAPILLNEPVTLTLSGNMQSLLTEPKINGDISLSTLNIKVPGFESLALGALDINNASFAMNEQGLSAGLKQLVLTQVAAGLDAKQTAQLEALTIKNVQWNGNSNDATVGEVSIQSTSADLDAVKNAGLKQLLIAGIHWRGNKDDVTLKHVTLSELNAELPDIKQTTLNTFTASDITVSQLSTEPTAQVASASLSGLLAKHNTAGDLTLDGLSVNTIVANAASQNIGKIALDGLTIMPPSGETPLVSLAHYEVVDIEATPASFRSGLHSFYGLVANATRLENGSIAGVPVSETAPVEATASDANTSVNTPVSTDTSEASAFSVEIAGIEMLNPTGDNNTASRFYFLDQGIKPAVATKATVLELRTGKINSAALEKGIELHIVLALDDYSRIRADGVMGLKGEYPEGNIKLNVEQLNLVEFNPYLVEAMGYRLKKGMLQVTSNISITDGQLGGKMVIVLQNSKFEPADEATIDRVSKQLSMPVETALSVLKDDNNNIRIEVPLSGDMSQPDVGINDVVNQISKKALKTATLYYLKQSLVPYGQLLSIASFAGDQLFAIRLDDLKYEPQQSELTDEHKAYLDTVGKMMSKKVALELQVCPVAGEQEQKAWGENWATEVAKRAATVKAYLAEIKDENDKSLSGRITLCTPQMGDKAKVILGV